MADSDEEYDRKKRDKFRRERSDYSSGGERRRSDYDRRPPSWRDEYFEARRRSRDEEADRDRRGLLSPPRRGEWSPPDAKRFRRGGGGWETLHDMGMGMMGGPYGMMERRGPWMMHGEMSSRGSHMGPGSRPHPGDMMMGFSGSDSRQRGATLLTFKQFLTQQDDSIDDTEAVRLYQEYKANYKKKQFHQFFNDHKEEDWFLSKYHPKYIEKIEQEMKKNLQRRVEVFESLCSGEKLKATALTQDESDAVIHLMDTAVILMEGGTELDLTTLEKDQENKEREEDKESASTVPDVSSTSEPAGDNLKDDDDQDEESGEEERRGMKRARDDEETAEDVSDSKRKEETKEPSPDFESEHENGTAAVAPTTEEDTTEPQLTETEQAKTTAARPETTPTPQESIPAKPRPLHLTKAIYIRHITPQVSPNDILEVCKEIPGFLRMGLAEPQPERGYERRGWITFTSDSNIKDICTKMGTQKIKNCQLTCQINRELSRRVKVAAGVTWARRAVESDVQLLLKLVEFFDSKCHLWSYSQREEEKDPESEEEEERTVKPNPVLALVAVAMESVSTVASSSDKSKPDEEREGDDEEGQIDDPGTEILKLDSPLIQVLDQLLWYLRLVHSFDYYNGTVFTDEDHMPHRCGIITSRPGPPKSVTNEEVNEYIKSMEAKVEPLLKEKTFLEGEELDKLGKRDHESEVEKFIEVNTQKLGENKYLCPLSGKKFRGPEFVRKHILNKHSHALEEVRSETDFFNNYLKDPDRPVPLDSSTVSTSSTDDDRRGGGGDRGGSSMGGWGSPDQMMMQGYPDMGMRRGRGGRPFRGRGDRRGGRRPMRSYNDLDMPDDMY